MTRSKQITEIESPSKSKWTR